MIISVKALLVSCVAIFAVSTHSVAQERPRPGRTHVVVVTGIGGEPYYTESFHRIAVSLIEASRKGGVPASAVSYLRGDGVRSAQGSAGFTTRATRDAVESVLVKLAQSTGPEDAVLIVLVGHGSGEGPDSRFNLPGPDMSARDFARILSRFEGAAVALVNAASSSGDFVPVLTGGDKRRVIITATKSGFERNETIFGRHFAAAFAGAGADVDKDGRVSLLEAFSYARREVEREYGTQGRILTEHAIMGGDSTLARTMALNWTDATVARAGGDADASTNQRIAALEREQQQIQDRVEALKARKDRMNATDYDRELETLLVELSLKTRALKEARKSGPGSPTP
ncbi:MAG: hypothetical protein ABR543_18575 [Gemmatimonadaceae bacterium]